MGRVNRPAACHHIYKIIHFECIDKSKDQNGLDRRAQQRKGNPEKCLYLSRSVQCRALIKFRRNGRQSCGNQDHVKRDSDPHIGTDQGEHGRVRGSEPVYILFDDSQTLQRIVQNTHVCSENKLKNQRCYCNRDHPWNEQQASDYF